MQMHFAHVVPIDAEPVTVVLHSDCAKSKDVVFSSLSLVFKPNSSYDKSGDVPGDFFHFVIFPDILGETPTYGAGFANFGTYTI